MPEKPRATMFPAYPDPKEKIEIEGKRKELAAKISETLKQKLTISEIEEIAVRLLSHEMIEEPPEIVRKYGEAMRQQGRLEKEGLEGFDYSKKQAWALVRDEVHDKIKRGEN